MTTGIWKYKKNVLVSAGIILICTLSISAIYYFSYRHDKVDVISRVAKTSDGKGYLEVDGKPFLFGAVENWGTQQIVGDTNGGKRFNTQPFDEPLSVSWMENVFEKTAELGYLTIAPFLGWNEIEPHNKGEYTFDVIDRYVDWAVKYDLRIDIVWLGTLHCGGARLKGENNGWMSWIPDYLQNKDKYFGKGTFDTDIFCSYVPDGGPNDEDAKFLHQSERDAVSALMDHLADYDTTHRVIIFQVGDEPNFSPYWKENKKAILAVQNEMGKVVKTSRYPIMTKIRLTGSKLDPDINELEYIDCNGVDPYVYDVQEIAAIGADQGGSHMPHIGENGAYYSNTTSLMIAILAEGGFYSTYHLNDHFGKFGFYDGDIVPYTEWKIGDIPPKRHSGIDVTRLNRSLNKMHRLVAVASPENMTGLNIHKDFPVDRYSGFVCLGPYDIGLQCIDGSVALSVLEDEYIYLASDTSSMVTYMVKIRPSSAEAGRLDDEGKWVSDRVLDIKDNGNGIFEIDAMFEDLVRIKMTDDNAETADWKLWESFSLINDDWSVPDKVKLTESDIGHELFADSTQGTMLLNDFTSSDIAIRGSIIPEEGYTGFVCRQNDQGSYYLLDIRRRSISLRKFYDSEWFDIWQKEMDIQQGTPINFEWQLLGSTQNILLNGENISGEIRDASIEAGRFGIWISYGKAFIIDLEYSLRPE